MTPPFDWDFTDHYYISKDDDFDDYFNNLRKSVKTYTKREIYKMPVNEKLTYFDYMVLLTIWGTLMLFAWSATGIITINVS